MYFKTQAGDLTGYLLKSIFIRKNQRNPVSSCWRCRSVANPTPQKKRKERRGSERDRKAAMSSESHGIDTYCIPYLLHPKNAQF